MYHNVDSLTGKARFLCRPPFELCLKCVGILFPVRGYTTRNLPRALRANTLRMIDRGNPNPYCIGRWSVMRCFLVAASIGHMLQ